MVHAGKIAGFAGMASVVIIGATRDRACGVSCTNVIYVLQIRYICLVKAIYTSCLKLLYDLYRDNI